jgi:hypothetical protein
VARAEGGAVIARALACAAASLLCAAAHAQNPFIEAQRESSNALPPLPPAPAAPAAVVRAFIDGCLAHDGDAMKTVDWTINQGYEWFDAAAGPGATLLAGRPGTVMAMPGSASRVLLAIDLDRRCTVWADRSEGPQVRAELVKALAALSQRGMRVQATSERSVERAGAWRQQTQWRLRRSEGAREWEVGAVTTLAAGPAAQVISVGPAPDAPPPSTELAASAPPPR